MLSVMERHVSTLLRQGIEGICPAKLSLSLIGSSSWRYGWCAANPGDPDVVADHVCIKIPYGGAILDLHLMYDCGAPDFPPDYTIGPKGDADFFISFDKMESLARWNPSDDSSLYCFVVEIVKNFKKFQLQKLETLTPLSDLRGELMELLETFESRVTLQDIEVYVSNTGHGSRSPIDSVKFAIRLPIDCATVHRWYNKREKQARGENNNDLASGGSGTTTALVVVSYSGGQRNKVKSQLFLSHDIQVLIQEVCFEMLEVLKQEYPRDMGLASYITTLTGIFRSCTAMTLGDAVKRREFLIAMARNSEISEYLVNWEKHINRLTFVMEMPPYNEFMYVVRVQALDDFPCDPPEVTFQSVYHMENKFTGTSLPPTKVYEEECVMNNMRRAQGAGPGTWDVGTMLTDTVTWIKEQAAQFQLTSIHKGKVVGKK